MSKSPDLNRESHEINFEAAWDFLKEISVRFGKSYETCRTQCHPPAQGQFGREELDYYGRFLAWYYAVRGANPAGARLYYRDFQARHMAEEMRGHLQEIPWCDAIGSVAKESAEAITAAVKNKSTSEIVKQCSEAITALETIIQMAHVHANEQSRGKVKGEGSRGKVKSIGRTRAVS